MCSLRQGCRSLRRGRPATVPAGVRDPSRVRPGPDRLGLGARSARPRWPVRRGGRPAGRAARRRAGARAAGPAGAVARAAPALRARRAAASRRAGGQRPQDAAQRALRAAPGARAGGPRRAGGRPGERVGLRGRGPRRRAGVPPAASPTASSRRPRTPGRGELLAGFDGDWALRARDEHAAELAGVLGALAARAEDAGDLPAAVAWARRRLEVEPLAEAAHRELIRLLALDGDRPAALAAARAMSERLRSELGIPPSAATRALVEDVRRGRIARPRRRRGERPSAAGRPGRRRAARGPRARAGAAGAGVGGRGVGRAALRRSSPASPGSARPRSPASSRGARTRGGGAVLLGRCDEHALVPFQPWIEALERLLDALPAADADHWLTAHDGALARLLPARSAAQAAGGRRRASATSRSSWCARCSTTSPRAGRSCSCSTTCTGPTRTRSRCCATSRGPRPRARLLVLLCARPTELEPAVAATLAELRREGPLVAGRPRGPRRRRGGRAARAAHRPTDRGAARRYRARSGGNPFFLDELLREAQEAGGDVDGPPAGVRDVIARRLARLGDADAPRARGGRRLRRSSSTSTTLARVRGPAGRRGARGARRRRRGRARRARPSRRGRYAFAHALVAETIVAALPASRRARLHLRDRRRPRRSPRRRRGGRRRGRPAPARRRGAGRRASAWRRWELAAAREATAALAHAEAAAHYEAALAARPGAADRAASSCSRWATPTTAPGGADQARAAFAEAAELARAAGDPALLARAALGHGGTAVVIAAADPTAVGLLEEALAAAPAGDPATSARLLARLSVELYYADPGPCPRARRAAPSSRRGARTIPPRSRPR